MTELKELPHEERWRDTKLITLGEKRERERIFNCHIRAEKSDGEADKVGLSLAGEGKNKGLRVHHGN